MNPEIFGSRIFMSPDSAPIREQSPLAPEKPRITQAEILKMDEAQLFDYITVDLKSAADKLYGESDAETLLIFLGGGKKHNIAKEKTVEKKSVYKKRPQYAKWSEIYEFMGAANDYTEGKRPLSAVVSEAADLVYNLALLSKADPRHAQDHMDQITKVSSIMGWRKPVDTNDPNSPLANTEALRLAAFKYHQRFIDAQGEKNPEREDTIMERLLAVDEFIEDSKPYVSSPTKDQVSKAFDWGTDFIKLHLRVRYKQVRHDKKTIRKAEKARKKELKETEKRLAQEHEMQASLA